LLFVCVDVERNNHLEISKETNEEEKKKKKKKQEKVVDLLLLQHLLLPLFSPVLI
jgi:hypothetical protein